MRIATLENGNSEISVWVVKSDGRKLTDPQERDNLVNSMRDQIEQPLRIKVVTRGLDTELLVATPIESCGRGRPRVVYDVSLALRTLDICIFQVKTGIPVLAPQDFVVHSWFGYCTACAASVSVTHMPSSETSGRKLSHVIIILIGTPVLLTASATEHHAGSVLI